MPEESKSPEPVASEPDETTVETSTLKRILKHEKLVGALITTVVLIIFSPITLSLSFYLNQVFSRPDLSVEYVELVLNEKPILLPSEALKGLVSSDSFRAALMRGSGQFANLLRFEHSQAGVSNREMRELRDGLAAFQSFIADRLKMLASFESSIAKELSEDDLRKIYAKYLETMGQYVSPHGDTNSLRSTLTGKIKIERGSLLESAKLATNLSEKLDHAKSEGVESIQLKLSILNRGNTDGLIRSMGEVSFPRQKVAFPIKRAAQKKSLTSGMMAMSVPVTVVNPPDDAQRSGAVGKVEKNSMVEFWFALDQDTLPPEKLASAITLLTATPTNSYEIVLFNHANRRVNFRKR